MGRKDSTGERPVYGSSVPKDLIGSNVRQRARRFWRQLRCRHPDSHMFMTSLNPGLWHLSREGEVAQLGILIRGCYLCGKVQSYDVHVGVG
jgi:hypothetical protein